MLAVLFVVCARAPGQTLRGINPVVAPAVEYFSLGDIKVVDPEFKALQNKGKDYLLWLNPDALLHFYRVEAGLAPKADAYAGWESEEVWGAGPLRGGFLGYYISSLAMMWQATGDPALMDRLRYTLGELNECRRAGKDGFIMGIKNGRELFGQVASGNIRSNNPTLNGAWAPVYLINKLMLGLGEAYRGCDCRDALPLLTGLADWFGTEVLDKLTDAQVQQMLVCEHGSINESYVLAYELTGDPKYLKWAGRLHDAAMWKPLSEGKDILHGWHANTQIPKFTGFFKYHAHTGDGRFATAAFNFWEIVTGNHTWAIGGNSTGEHFFPSGEFPRRVLLKGGPETCNSANMLRLTEALFTAKPSARMADYYERVLLNHILSAYDPIHGMCCYFTSMRPGHYRVYGSRDKSFWCCQQTGMESPAKLGKFIYAKKEGGVMVNLFISSRVELHERGITLEQRSDLPESGEVTFVLHAPGGDATKLLIRKPSWASDACEFEINGKRAAPTCDASGYWELSGPWKNKNEIRLKIPMSVRTEPLPGCDDFFAFMRGPYVLAARLGSENLPDSFWSTMGTTAENTIAWENLPRFRGPVETIPRRMKKTTSRPVRLRLPVETSPHGLIFEPFYRVHFERYGIYWKIDKNGDGLN
ncbi:DUF1680 family protein [Ereboglobus sp. PH5-5]|uniref:glycoside hydrolase family 127 protein n=1 Tax=Ereboglobus sp. PH5-5 TaxID=2940529 RepID=UPI0024064BFA|nr:glycoside hydrolase family 127 protein [Ereboglobus sp. PH5-5]MDF9833486.1 DUF1680 family protein [Ereboglobus sp. PH5-5]